MTRSIPEWIGKSEDTPIPPRVKARIVERQGGKCAETGLIFGPKMAPEFDHIIALINGGQNRESNIQAICAWAHAQKTKQDVAQKSKNARVRSKHLGIHQAKSPLPGSRKSKWKRKVNGTVVPR